MGRTIGTIITLTNKFTPVLNQIGQGIGAFNGKVVNTNKNVGNMANGFNNAFNRMSKGAKGAAESVGSSIRGIGMKVAGIAGIGFGADAFIKQTDAYTGIQARLQLINDGQQTVAQLNDKIFKSAGDARVEYNQMADVIGKLGINAKDAFKNNDEMVKFSELLTKNFKISGASAMEQTSAMYQLTQAMSAGKLQGDEFRSIMENAPLLAQAIAKEMNVPMGQLKEMSKDGEITSEVIKKAMFNSANDINKKFGEIPMTFSDVGNKIKNTVERNLQPTFKNISKWLNSDGVGKGLELVLQKGQNLAKGFGNLVTPQLKDFSSYVKNNVVPVIKEIGDNAKDFYDTHGPALEGAFNSAKGFAKDFFDAGLYWTREGMQWIKDNGETVEGIIGGIGKAFEAAGKFISGDFNGALRDTLGIFEKLSDNSFANVWAYVKNGMPREKTELEKNTEEYGNQLGFQKWLDTGGFMKDTAKNQGIIPRSREWKKKNEKQDEVYKNAPENRSYKRGEMPAFANGTSFTPKGLLVKNEKGGEITVSRGGEAIIPADQTQRLLKNQNMNDTVVINKSTESTKPNINLYITIQGNVIGNEELYDDVGQHISNRLSLALGNV